MDNLVFFFCVIDAHSMNWLESDFEELEVREAVFNLRKDRAQDMMVFQSLFSNYFGMSLTRILWLYEVDCQSKLGQLS